MIDEKKLLKRYLNEGDGIAFKELVDTHAEMVFSTACRVLGNRSEAEDVAQEVFVALATKSNVMIHSVGGWLHAVTVLKSRKAIRTASRRRVRESILEVAEEEASETSWNEIQPIVDESIDSLPEEMRDLLVSYFLKQESQAAIAERFGINQSSISRKLEIAMKELRKKLKHKGVLCGAGLTSLLLTRTAEAVPAGLNMSLGKLAMSGYSGAAVSTTTPISLLLTMTTTTKVISISAAALVLGGALKYHNSSSTENTSGDRSSLEASVTARDSRAKERAERSYADVQPKVIFPSQEEFNEALIVAFKEQDRERQLQMFHDLGLIITMEGLETVHADLGKRQIDVTHIGFALDLFLAEWIKKDPAAALAWFGAAPYQGHFPPSSETFLCNSFAEGLISDDIWENVLKESVGPAKIANFVDLREAYLVAVGKHDWEFGEHIGRRTLIHMLKVDRERTIKVIFERNGNREFYEGALRSLTYGTSLEEGSKMAHQFFADRPEDLNVLLGLLGDPQANFVKAVQNVSWDSKHSLLDKWSSLNPGEAIRYATDSKHEANGILYSAERLLKISNRKAISSDEFAEWICDASGSGKDRAWDDYYSWRTSREGVTESLLNEVINNPHLNSDIGPTKSILAQWAKKAPEEALQWVNENIESGSRAPLTTPIYRQLATTNPELVIRKADEFSRRERHAVISALATYASQHSPEEMATFLGAQVEEPAFHDKALGRVTASNFQDVNEAISFITTHAKKDPQNAALNFLYVSSWQDNADFDSLRSTISGIGEIRSENRKMYVEAASEIARRMVFNNRGGEALEWSFGMPDGDAIRGIFLRSGSEDQKDIIRKWVETAEISDEDRARISSQMEPRPGRVRFTPSR